ncbi:MFS transporter [Achromobacter spanius]|uniref:MFS transporter n=1 Tax=Achromobacter spanius TaxID=217203 RepID=UPI00380E9A76
MPTNPRNTSLIAIPGVAPLLAAVALGVSSFSILLPLSPSWAIRAGSNEASAGAVTAVLMGFTILTQFIVNRALKRYGWGLVLIVGLLALGAPATLQATSFGLPAILASSALRGIGFGILTVGGATAIALLVPLERRGAAVGAYGLAVAVPQLLLVSSAPVLDQVFGKVAMTILATLPLVGLLWVRPLGALLDKQTTPSEKPGSNQGAASPSTLILIAPVLLSLLVVTSSGGAMLTFARQITDEASQATIVLLCLTGCATPTRWAFGTLSDRYKALHLIGGLSLVCCLGMAAVSASILGANSMALLYVGSVLLGIAYGGLQSATLVCAFKLGGTQRLAPVSVLWNVTFDLGTGLGSMLTGLIAAEMGFPTAFGLLAFAAVVCSGCALWSLRQRLRQHRYASPTPHTHPGH